jgi:hypothetical protein
VIDVVNDQAFAVNAFQLLMPYDSLFHTFPDDGFANLTEVTPPTGNWLTGILAEVSFVLPQAYDVANNQIFGVPVGFNAVLAPGGVLDNIVLEFDWDPLDLTANPQPGAFDWVFYEAPPPNGDMTVVASGRAIPGQYSPPEPPTPNPEPASLALLGIGIVGLAVQRRRRLRAG